MEDFPHLDGQRVPAGNNTNEEGVFVWGMGPYNETAACILFHGFAASEPHKIASWIQVGVASLGNVLLLVVWLLLGVVPGVEKTVKTLLCYSYLFILTHNFFTAVNQSRIQLTFLTNVYCNLFSAWSCMLVRIPQLFCFVGLVLTHLTIVFDRAFSTLRPLFYESNGSRSLPYYIGSIMITTFLLTCVAVIEEPLYPYRPYCTITNDSSATKVNYLFKSLLILTFLSALTLCFLLVYNIRSLQRKTHNFNLNSHYQFKTNLIAIKFSAASTVLALIVNLGFLGANASVRMFMSHLDKIDLHAYLEITYIVPIHAFANAIVILFFAIRQKRARVRVVDADPYNEHFGVLRDLWK